MCVRARTGSVICLLALLATPVRADITINLGREDVVVHVPESYDENRAAPLFVLLHRYGGDANEIKDYLGLESLAEEFGFLYTAPNGTLDDQNTRFWNATDACCDFFGSGVDDSSYLRELVDAIRGQLNVNDRRIYFLGHSNGGFMAHRMACDHADIVAGIMSLAGVTFEDPLDCTPSEPVHVLQIHGTQDGVIRYNGGLLNGRRYPGARETAAFWASHGSCLPDPDGSLPNLDLESNLPGAESTVLRWEAGCAHGGSAELWSIVGGRHIPALSEGFSRLVIEHLMARPKPGAWSDLGLGLAGTHGIPVASGEGSLVPGEPLSLRLTGALELASTFLVVGFSRQDIPFAGGTMVPLPEAVFPGLQTDASGEALLSGVWPSDVSPEFETYFQFWVLDAGGPEGLAASNALLGITP